MTTGRGGLTQEQHMEREAVPVHGEGGATWVREPDLGPGASEG